jgi:predicted transcriptional regulator
MLLRGEVLHGVDLILMTNLKLLPKPEKKVVAKVLTGKGFSLRMIGEMLGVSKDTVSRYSDNPTPDELIQFETEIESHFKIKENIVAAKALARMDEKMTTSRINEALDVYKVMRGKETGGINVAQNQNINYIIQTTKDEQEFNSATSKPE